MQSYITWSDGELPTPTFHCKCGQDTEGWSLCLKCEPQHYKVYNGENQDMMIEQHKLSGIDIEKWAGHNDSVYAREIWNAAIERAAQVIDQCNREGPYMAIGSAGRIRELKK